jgi:hypothetical protein
MVKFKSIAAVAAVVMAIFTNFPVKAEVAGRDLYNMCNSREGSTENIICKTYIHGFVGGLIAAQYERGKICIPQRGITDDELKEPLLRLWAGNSEKLTQPAMNVLSVVADLVWACGGR